MGNEKLRTKDYLRNVKLEALLREVNDLLSEPNVRLRGQPAEQVSKLFVVGPHRSGSTVFMQWIASTGLVAYPSNLMSRFYGAPLVGAKIQQLLTDPRYNFRDEILDFSSPINFESENGKTKGALAPNEFWYFWRRFLPFGELEYMPDSEIRRVADLPGLKADLNGLAEIFQKPFALKGMIMNQNIPVLDGLFDKALFIWLVRDPIYNIQSALEARRRQFGDLRTWYSFRIKEYPALKDLDPLESVAGQIYSINKAVDGGLRAIPSERKLVVNYEDFCHRPGFYYEQLVDLLAAQNGLLTPAPVYAGNASFKSTNRWVLKEYTAAQAEAAYARFEEKDL